MVAYAQPLLDETDGSPAQVQNALTLAQLCWNLALLPELGSDDSLSEMRKALKMDEDEFEGFRRDIILPMIQRHHEMFPGLAPIGSMDESGGLPVPRTRPATASRAGKFPGTGRNEPCPCNSGKKYKRCCGR
ncbi:MAG: SEC-C metal-binding domain-containing protein [Candidatus Sumerlaeota bacterium]|nr:SEC-C metal-binding domain-containing protein [Candidatus Sumerlaeota bacterium]